MEEKIADISSLKEVWFNNLIPLLNEYFYCDWLKLNKLIKPFLKPLLSKDIEAERKLHQSLDEYETSEIEQFEFKSILDFKEDQNFFDALKELETL